MKNLLAVSLFFGLILCFSSPTFAALDQDDVKEMLENLKSGENFSESGALPSEQIQVLRIGIGQGLFYVIDFKAQMCFTWSKIGKSHVPCKGIKKGYPMIAPLIGWDHN